MDNAAYDIEQQLRTLVAARLNTPAADIADTATLSTDLGADSLDMVSLVMDIEDEFDIDIPDEEAAQLLTFKELADYVRLATAANDTIPSRQIEPPAHSANVRH